MCQKPSQSVLNPVQTDMDMVYKYGASLSVRLGILPLTPSICVSIWLPLPSASWELFVLDFRLIALCGRH